MKKRLSTILIMMMVLFILSSTTCFASNDISVIINDYGVRRQVQFDTKPVIENGRVLVPASAIFKEFGLRMEWDNGTKTMYALAISNIIYCTEIQIGNQYPLQYEWYVNPDTRDPEDPFSNIQKTGISELYMDVPAKIIGGRVMVPVRFIGETLGCTVKWNPKTRVVELYTDPAVDDIVDNTISNEPIDSQPVSEEQKAINNQYVETFDDPVDSYPEAFQ